MINKLIRPIVHLLPENNTLERIWVLAKVDFKSRYYYHRLGILWALIRPIIELIVYYFVFNTIFSTDIDHFALYLFSGLIVWYFFAEGTTKGISILLSKRYLIESVTFNKVYIILSSVLSSLFGFIFNFTAYLSISYILGNPPSIANFLIVLLIIIITSNLILGIALILAALSIYLKDIQHAWDMVILCGFWLTPIVYSEVLMEETFPLLIYANPMASLVILFHDTILNSNALDLTLLIWSTFYSIFMLIIGLLLFSRYSHKSAEKL